MGLLGNLIHSIMGTGGCPNLNQSLSFVFGGVPLPDGHEVG